MLCHDVGDLGRCLTNENGRLIYHYQVEALEKDDAIWSIPSLWIKTRGCRNFKFSIMMAKNKNYHKYL